MTRPSSARPASQQRTNYVALNKKTLHLGAITAHSVSDARKTTTAYQSIGRPVRAPAPLPSHTDPEFVYGQTAKTTDPPMKLLLQQAYRHDWLVIHEEQQRRDKLATESRLLSQTMKTAASSTRRGGVDVSYPQDRR